MELYHHLVGNASSAQEHIRRTCQSVTTAAAPKQHTHALHVDDEKHAEADDAIKKLAEGSGQLMPTAAWDSATSPRARQRAKGNRKVKISSVLIAAALFLWCAWVFVFLPLSPRRYGNPFWFWYFVPLILSAICVVVGGTLEKKGY